MKQVFVDSNIFLEVLARKGPKSDRSLVFLESGKKLWTTELVISEIEWVLRAGYELPKATIVSCLKRVLTIGSVTIDRKRELIEAVSLFEHTNADWVDCIHAVRCNAKSIQTVVSYDQHFDRFSGLTRIEP